MNDTITIKTPEAGAEIVLKATITGGEDEDIQSVLEDSLAVQASSKGQGSAEVPGGILKAMRHKALEIVVRSINGSSDDIINRLRALSRVDYKFVCAEVDKITEGDPAKKA